MNMQPHQNIIALHPEQQPTQTKGTQSEPPPWQPPQWPQLLIQDRRVARAQTLFSCGLEPPLRSTPYPSPPTRFGRVALQNRWDSKISLLSSRTQTHEKQAIAIPAPHIFKPRSNP